MTEYQDLSAEERRRLAEERWNKEFGPAISPQKKMAYGALFVIAFFGILAAVFYSATY